MKGRKRCSKIQYSKKEVQTELNKVIKSHKKWRREIRYYCCPICNHFHLTSKKSGGGKLDIKIEHTSKWEELLNKQYEKDN